MTPSHSIATIAPRTNSFRWDDSIIALARDAFLHSHYASQRQYARDHGIPRATLGSWLRDDPGDDPDFEPEVKDFFRSGVGQRFLRRLLLALFVDFLFGGSPAVCAGSPASCDGPDWTASSLPPREPCTNSARPWRST